MKNNWQILTFLLALTLLIFSIRGVQQRGSGGAQELQLDRQEIGLELLMTRSSVRSYTDQPVEAEMIETILRAGMAAPTAGNRQPWDFVVVTDRAILEKLPTVIPGSHMAAEAPLAIVVVGTPARALMPAYWVQDCSAASENILLAAHALGLGAVWSGAYPNNDKDRVGRLSELLSLPEGSYALNVIVMGYPDSEPVIKDKWDPAKVHYNQYE